MLNKNEQIIKNLRYKEDGTYLLDIVDIADMMNISCDTVRAVLSKIDEKQNTNRERATYSYNQIRKRAENLEKTMGIRWGNIYLKKEDFYV